MRKSEGTRQWGTLSGVEDNSQKQLEHKLNLHVIQSLQLMNDGMVRRIL